MRLERPRSLVLGIDPGLTRMGLGLVKVSGSSLSFVSAATVRTRVDLPHADRLRTILEDVSTFLETHRPDVVAMERVYLKTNSATAVGAIQAAGAAMAAAAQAGLEVHEYSAAQVKLAVVGNGSASKHQVHFMLARLLGDVVTDTADAADALAVAITHVNHSPMRRLALVASR